MLELGLRFSVVLASKAICLFDLGKYEESISYCDQALDADQDSNRWYNKRILPFKRREDAEYIEYPGSSIKLNSIKDLILHNKGIALFHLGRYEEFIDSFDKVIETNENSALDWYGRGLSYGNLKKWDESIHNFIEAIRLEPHYDDAYYAMSRACNEILKTDQKDGDVYNRCCDMILKINPIDSISYNNKGALLDTLGIYDKAIDCFSKAIDLDANYAIAWYNNASSRVKTGDIENGLSYLKKAMEVGDRKYMKELALKDNAFE